MFENMAGQGLENQSLAGFSCGSQSAILEEEDAQWQNRKAGAG